MENFQHARKIWNEFGRPSSNLGQDKKKIQAYKVSNVDLLDLLKTYFNDMNLEN
jgi:hypothetical protein